jgi:hypothetical protein
MEANNPADDQWQQDISGLLWVHLALAKLNSCPALTAAAAAAVEMTTNTESRHYYAKAGGHLLCHQQLVHAQC